MAINTHLPRLLATDPLAGFSFRPTATRAVHRDPFKIHLPWGAKACSSRGLGQSLILSMIFADLPLFFITNINEFYEIAATPGGLIEIIIF